MCHVQNVKREMCFFDLNYIPQRTHSSYRTLSLTWHPLPITLVGEVAELDFAKLTARQQPAVARALWADWRCHDATVAAPPECSAVADSHERASAREKASAWERRAGGRSRLLRVSVERKIQRDISLYLVDAPIIVVFTTPKNIN